MLRLKTLGTPVIEGSGGPLPGAAAQRRPLALLALLAVANERGLSRDKIVAYLWPEAEPEKAAHRLNQLLYALRRDLGSDELFLGSSDLRLNPTVVTTDLAEFTAALRRRDFGQAVAAYGGPFLDGFYLEGTPEFERWSEDERADLAKRYGSALETVASAAGERGDLATAVEWRRKLARLDPLDSRAALRLMEVLQATGDPAGALQVARVHEALIREEHNAAPDPAITALVDRIRRTAADQLPGRTSDWASAGSGQPTPAVGHLGPPAEDALRGREFVRVSRSKLAWGPWIVPTVGGGLAVLALIALIASSHRKPAFDPKRIAVARFENRTGDASLDPLGSIAADWMTRGLSETHLVDVVDGSAAMTAGSGSSGSTDRSLEAGSVRELALQTAAGTVVAGSYYEQRDSLYFEAKIVGAADEKVLAALPPIGAPASLPLTAIDALRRRVMVALAFRFDPRLRDFPSISEPPNYEAYRRFVEGLELHMRFDFRGAIREFTLAATSDSLFRAPLIIAAVDHFFLNEFAAADSLARLVSRSQEQMTPIEELLLKWLQAKLSGDNAKALQVSREFGRLAPGTVTQLTAAIDALWLNRPHEALDVIAKIDPDRGLLRDSGFVYWWAMATSYHMLGDHGRELRAANDAWQRYPNNWDTGFLEMRALAACGRLSELRARLDESTTFAPGALWTRGLALIIVGQELRAHGHEGASQDVFARVVAWQRTRPPEERATAESRYLLASAFYLGRNWEAARRLNAELTAEDTTDWSSQATLAMLAARRGDRSEAERIAGKLVSIHQPYLFGEVTIRRANIAALLGNREEAVALLRQALAEGFPFVDQLHIDMDFEPLHGYAPFEALLRPQD
jgi:DNA-binding SARP family transcriptional activator/tetratricopeptide (TPR) repeat protein